MDCDKELESNCVLQAKSHLAPFIAKIMDMLKKPTIEADLGKVLQDFASKLDDCGRQLNNSMNFAEIALLIQNSANLYSKKVDILWDFTLDYQQRIISKENNLKENEVERDKLEERKRKYKRRRKTNVNNSEIQTIVEKFSFSASAQPAECVDYLNKVWESHGLELKWRKFDIASASSPKTDSHGIRHESSQLFLPTDAVYSEDNEYIGRYNQFHAVSCLLSKAETANSTSTPLTLNNNNYIKEKSRPVSCCSRRLSFVSDPSPSSSCKLPFIVLKPLSDEILAEKLHRPLSSFSDACRSAEEEEHLRKKMRRMSSADSLLDSQEDSFFSGDEDSLAAPPIEKRNKSISQESGFFEDFDETISSKCLGRSTVILERHGGVKLARIMNKILKTKSPRKKRVNKKLIEKLSQGLSVNLSDFEQFLQLHYKPADGEGERVVQRSPLRTIAEESEDEDEPEDVPEAAPSPLPPVQVQEEDDDVEPTQPEEQPRPPDIANVALLEESRRTVSEWRASILPKLRDSVKSTFDIHEYGASILKDIEVGEKKLFKDVVKSKTRREINGYFLAALHLANTRNVEISGSQSGKISNETFELKVISRKRHHEELEEYQAPSEVFSSSRSRVSSNHSKEEPPRKRIKLTIRKIQ